VRLLLGVRLATLGLLVVGGVTTLVLLWLRLKGIWLPTLLPVALVTVAVGALIGAMVRPLPDGMVAASTDRRLHLCDRLATALQLGHKQEQSGMEQAMVMDALYHMQQARVVDAYPLRAYRSTKAAGFCLAALVLVQALPIPPLLLSPQERKDKAVLKQEAAKIEPVAKKLGQEAKKNNDAEAQKVAQKLKQLAMEFRQGKVDKKQALLSLREMDQKLEELEKSAAPPLKIAGKAADELKKAAQEGIAAKARELAEQATRQGNQDAERNLKELAQQAMQANETSELKSLADQLSKEASKMGQEVKAPAELLTKLSEALSAQDWEKVLKELGDLQGTLDKASTQLSQEELRELAKQLEELAKVLKEMDLKKLAECLKNAGECLKAGNCQGAAKFLAEGLKEGECKAWALAQASGEARNCVQGSAKSLRSGSSATSSEGAKAGSGLGIGPDTGSQKSIPPDAEAAKLYAPRETATSGSLQEVPGQVNPRGEMFTITEKGAPATSSKSRVPYYEVLPAYSKAAEEALQREEVPPAYRAMVREYFKALQPEAAPSNGNASQ
jgi:G:T/U-mismatch repair DNA glycosylase